MRGTQGAICTPRCKCGSRPESVACPLGVQSREIWHVTTGSLSAELEPSKTTENPHINCFLVHCCKTGSTVATVASGFPRPYSYGHYYARMERSFACVDMMLRVCAVCASCTCVRVSGSAHVCAAALGRPPFRTIVVCRTGHVRVSTFSYSYLYLSGAYISVH